MDAPNPLRARPSGRVVALTGAASFLGRNLVGVLEEDPRTARIVAIDVKAPDTSGPKTRMYPVDLTAPASEERVAEILAAEGVDTLAPPRLPLVADARHRLGPRARVGRHDARAQRRAAGRTCASSSCGARRSSTARTRRTRTSSPSATRSAPTPSEPFFADKIAAEREVATFAAKAKGTVVTVLRTAPIVGPTVNNYVTRYLAERVVITLLGFDPLWQFVHEVDAIAAFKLAIDRDFPGVFNIVGEGVLPALHGDQARRPRRDARSSTRSPRR